MKLLSDLLDALICPVGVTQVMDDFFAVGCALAGSRFSARDATAQVDILRQARGLMALHGFLRPCRPGDGIRDEYKVFGSDKTVINDLYVPGSRVDEDGFMHIHFPVPIQTPLSSSFISRDWRFVALAWIAVIDSGVAPTKMVFTACDAAGRRVMAMVEPDVLDAFKAMLKANRKYMEIPGPVCRRCGKTDTCESLQAVLDPHLEGVAEPLPKDKAMATEALFYRRMELETRIEILEERRRKTDQLLNAACADGLLKIGGESIQIPKRMGHQWDFGRAYAVLQPAGLWDHGFGSIRVAALQAAMADFPADIREKLKTACVETTAEPSISEAARHGRTVKPTLLRGITRIR